MPRHDDPAPLDASGRHQAQRDFLRDYGSDASHYNSWIIRICEVVDSWSWRTWVTIAIVATFGVATVAYLAFAAWAREYSDIQVF